MRDKKPSWVFWSTILVAVVLAYVILAGPLCWASSRWGTGRLVTEVYQPLTRLLNAADNDVLTDAFLSYSNLLASNGFGWQAIEESRWHWRRLWLTNRGHYKDEW